MRTNGRSERDWPCSLNSSVVMKTMRRNWTKRRPMATLNAAAVDTVAIDRSITTATGLPLRLHWLISWRMNPTKKKRKRKAEKLMGHVKYIRKNSTHTTITMDTSAIEKMPPSRHHRHRDHNPRHRRHRAKRLTRVTMMSRRRRRHVGTIVIATDVDDPRTTAIGSRDDTIFRFRMTVFCVRGATSSTTVFVCHTSRRYTR